MILHRISALVLLAAFGIVAGCDAPPGPTDPTSSPANIRSLAVEPDSISFQHINTFYDTTVTLDISARISNQDEAETPSFAIKTINDSLVTRGMLQATDSTEMFRASVDLDLTTATFGTYFTYVYADGSSSDGSWIQSRIDITGLSGSPPTILAVQNPDTVYKPGGDTVRNVPFQAQVTDPDGQSNISTVAFELRRNNNVLDVIELFDDGSGQSGDAVEGDSVYTQVLSVNAGNETATYDIYYYAVDKAQLVSDTVKTTFTITE